MRGCRFKYHKYLHFTVTQLFPCPDIKRHTFPPVIVKENLHGCITFRQGILRHCFFFPVASILSQDEAVLNILRRMQGRQDTNLFPVHLFTSKHQIPRLFHRHYGKDLKQMVLHHIFHGPAVVIISASCLHPNLLQG